MPLSTAMAVYFTQPISVAVISFLFNHESLSKIEVLSIVSAMCGVMLMTNPGLVLPSGFVNEEHMEE